MASQETSDNIGNLASISDNKTNVFLNSLNSKKALVGGKKDSSGKWVWSDGSSWNFTNWGAGQPSNSDENENYLEINKKENGQWNDVPLSYEHEHGYICQYSQGIICYCFEIQVHPYFFQPVLMDGDTFTIQRNVTNSLTAIRPGMKLKVPVRILLMMLREIWLLCQIVKQISSYQD